MMLILSLFSLLMLSSLQVYGQFNTIRSVKRLLSVHVLLPQEQALGADTASFGMSAQAPSGALTLSMPLRHAVISSAYGPRYDPFTGEWVLHQGIDFSANQDTVRAIMPGWVNRVGYSRGLGYYIEVEHGTYRSIYGHLSRILVSASTVVPGGASLAITGSTGRSTGEHLHFALQHKGQMVNPTPYLEVISRRLEKAGLLD